MKRREPRRDQFLKTRDVLHDTTLGWIGMTGVSQPGALRRSHARLSRLRTIAEEDRQVLP
jgi:hypothetical protein